MTVCEAFPGAANKHKATGEQALQGVLGVAGSPCRAHTCPDVVDVLLYVLDSWLMQAQTQLQFQIQFIDLGGHYDPGITGTLSKPLLEVLKKTSSKSGGETSKGQPCQEL